MTDILIHPLTQDAFAPYGDILALKSALPAGDKVLEIEHFRLTHAQRFDCLPEMNPFIAEDFASLPTDVDFNKSGE